MKYELYTASDLREMAINQRKDDTIFLKVFVSFLANNFAAKGLMSYTTYQTDGIIYRTALKYANELEDELGFKVTRVISNIDNSNYANHIIISWE